MLPWAFPFLGLATGHLETGLPPSLLSRAGQAANESQTHPHLRVSISDRLTGSQPLGEPNEDTQQPF
jgi:hypothetical protein